VRLLGLWNLILKFFKELHAISGHGEIYILKEAKRAGELEVKENQGRTILTALVAIVDMLLE
jgi:hypothetical protein